MWRDREINLLINAPNIVDINSNINATRHWGLTILDKNILNEFGLDKHASLLNQLGVPEEVLYVLAANRSLVLSEETLMEIVNLNRSDTLDSNIWRARRHLDVQNNGMQIYGWFGHGAYLMTEKHSTPGEEKILGNYTDFNPQVHELMKWTLTGVQTSIHGSNLNLMTPFSEKETIFLAKCAHRFEETVLYEDLIKSIWHRLDFSYKVEIKRYESGLFRYAGKIIDKINANSNFRGNFMLKVDPGHGFKLIETKA